MHDFAGVRNAALDVGDGIAGFGLGTGGEVDAIVCLPKPALPVCVRTMILTPMLRIEKNTHHR
jgi:hypothetical protein